MLLKIYLKELKDCFRDRRTLLLTVFLPIVMMTALTLFYEKLGSESEGKSYVLAVSNQIAQEEEALISIYENIELLKVVSPEEAVQEGEAQAALILSANFITSVQEGKEASATLIGDSFSQNSSMLMSMVNSALVAYEKQVISARLQVEGVEESLIQPFVVEQKEMSEEESGIHLLAMLIPLILVLAISVGSNPAASDLFAGEKERKTMEALLMTPVSRSTVLLAKWLTVSTIGTFTGIITLAVVVMEINFLTENLKKGLSFGDDMFIIVALALIISIVFSMFNASILVVTSIIGKTVKEAQSYSTPIMMLCVFPPMLLTTVGVNELQFQHFAIPILNLFSILKELLFGIIDFQHIAITLGTNMISMVIIFIIARTLFLKDKWVMN